MVSRLRNGQNQRLGSAAVKKILEIDATETYHRTGQLCWNSHSRKRSQLNTEWIHSVFTPAQQQFLKKHSYTARPHPKHSPTVEIFINEQTLTESEWTVLHLLFTTRRNHRD